MPTRNAKTRAALLAQQQRIQKVRLQATPLPKRVRAKIRRQAKRRFNLPRRIQGAIGAGHFEADRFRDAVAAEMEHERFRRLVE